MENELQIKQKEFFVIIDDALRNFDPLKNPEVRLYFPPSVNYVIEGKFAPVEPIPNCEIIFTYSFKERTWQIKSNSETIFSVFKQWSGL